MKRDWSGRVRDVREYLYLGSSMRYLQDCDVGWRVHGDAFILGNLDSLFVTLEGQALTRSLHASEPLRRQREGLRSSPPDHRLTKDEAEALRRNVKTLKVILREELSGCLTFRVVDGAVPSRDLLLDMAPHLGVLGEGLASQVGEDLEEAGRALALDCPTASAFLLLRGLGRGLRAFHHHWVGSPRGPGGYWGALVDDLKARPPAPPEDLMRTLDFLRSTFLGLVNLPERRFGRAEVEDLLPLCREALARMQELMEEAPG